MKKITLILVVIACFTNVHAQVLSEWRGLGRTGIYEQEINLLKEWPQDGPELLWYADSLPKGYSSVAVAHNKVYLTGYADSMDIVIAFDMQGNKLWETPYGRAWDNSYNHSRSTPTIEGNKIFLSSGYGDIACINAHSGAIVWQVKARDDFEGEPGKFGYSESVLVLYEMVYFTPSGNRTTMVSLNKSNGELLWESESLNNRASYASSKLIHVNEQPIILNFTEQYLFAVNAYSGKILWKFDFGSYAGGQSKRNNQTNTPLFYNNEIFITSGYDHKSVMLSLIDNGNNVEVKWVDSILDVHHGGVVQIDGYIYGANWKHNRMGNWTCIKWDTGETMYSEEWGNKGAVIAADGMLYCFDEKSGTIGIAPVNPQEFKIVSSMKLPYGEGPYWAHPVISKGKLYMRSATALMVYNIEKK